MNTTIQLEHILDNQHSTATSGFGFESIDACLLSAISGGQGQGGQGQGGQNPNFLQRWGQNMQKGGEYAMAAGAVGTVVPGLGETGIPEGVAAGGGAAWLVGKGTEALGGLFH